MRVYKPEYFKRFPLNSEQSGDCVLYLEWIDILQIITRSKGFYKNYKITYNETNIIQQGKLLLSIQKS